VDLFERDNASNHHPKLFRCSAKSCEFKVDRIPRYCQADLKSDEIFFLDCFHEVFLWIGTKTSDSEKITTLDIVQRYVAIASERRKEQISHPVIVIEACDKNNIEIMPGTEKNSRV